MHRSFVTCGLSLLVAAAIPAASNAQPARGPEVGRALRHDVSRRLGEMALPPRGPSGEHREVPLRVPPRATRPEETHGPDALRQTESMPVAPAAATPAPTLTFEGLSDDNNSATVGYRIVPPDTEGDVGIDYYVQWINSIFAIYRKSDGVRVFGPVAGNSVWSGFGGYCQNNNDGDPIVLFDHLAGRWFFSQFSINQGIQCVALSQGSNPQGPYDRWAFTVSPGQNNDYPKFGLMPDAYYLTVRDFPSNSGGFAGFVAFDRVAMLAGASSPTFIKYSLPCYSNNCPDGVQPPHLEGPAPPAGTPGIFSRAWDDSFDGPLTGGVDGYRLWSFHPNFSSPSSSTFTELAIVPSSAPFNSDVCGYFNRTCIPQGGTTQKLDPVDELQMYRAQYRHFADHDSLLISTTVDADGADTAGPRWAELRNTGSGWSLYQDGTFAPADGLNRWMSSVAMDQDGNIALGYSVSNSSNYPSIRYTSRSPSDPLGMMPGGEVELIAGTGSQISGSYQYRWGDYAAMSVDPNDGCTFWFTQEYYQTSGTFDFNTRIGAFKLADCGGPPAVCGNDTIEGSEVCDGTDLGGATCGDLGCTGGGTLACNSTCDGYDTSACGECPVCDNDGICELGEDCVSCPNDCVSGTVPAAVCGNGVCETKDGEDCVTCPTDCAGIQKGKPSNRFCCGLGGDNPVGCNDTACTTGGYACTTDSAGPGGSFCCGDLTCEAGESCSTCGLDCNTGAEVCDNGTDDDCDGFIDCDDSDCSGDPACDVSFCLGTDAACTSNSECCSNNCRSHGKKANTCA